MCTSHNHHASETGPHPTSLMPDRSILIVARVSDGNGEMMSYGVFTTNAATHSRFDGASSRVLYIYHNLNADMAEVTYKHVD